MKCSFSQAASQPVFRHNPGCLWAMASGSAQAVGYSQLIDGVAASGTLGGAPILQACCVPSDSRGFRQIRCVQTVCGNHAVTGWHRHTGSPRRPTIQALQCPRQSCFYTFERHRE